MPAILSLDTLATPALVLDASVMQRNISQMNERSKAAGIPLRPHGKTPKSVEVIRQALGTLSAGLTVSTLKEAEEYFTGGIRDIFYAVPLAPEKAARACELIRRGAHLTCMLDHPGGLNQIARTARKMGVDLPICIEIDLDGYRTGVRGDSPDFIDLCRKIAGTEGLRLKGIMSYAGASYGCTPAEARDLAERHRSGLVQAQAEMLSIGLACEMVSFGSTPAFLHAADLNGLTEIRCGIYIFQDLFQAAIGACEIDDIALSVLTTIIGIKPENNRIVVDAGALALSKDVSTQKTGSDAGYGLVCLEDGQLVDDLFVCGVSQELGVVSTRTGKPLPFERFAIGQKLRILPNHSDMTAAAHDKYFVVEGGSEIKAVWSRFNNW